MVREIAALRRGTLNFYLYDLAAITAKVEALRATLPRQVHVYYAMKANPHVGIVAHMKRLGVEGIEIASSGEMSGALTAFSGPEIIFTGPGKSPEELHAALQAGMEQIHVESLMEAWRLSRIAGALGRTVKVLVRINPAFHIDEAQTRMGGDSMKFGIDEEQIEQLLPAILQLPHLEVVGFHVFAASGVLDYRLLLKNAELVFELVRRLEARFERSFPVIDLGGGIGVDYLGQGQHFDLAAFGRGLSDLLASEGLADRKLIFELGRFLVGDCGFFVTEILDIKTSRGVKQVVCAGGTNHFRRPAALKINHPVTILHRDGIERPQGVVAVDQEKVYIGGPLCTSADKLALDLYLEHAEIGDLAVFELAGAYGLSMSATPFLSHPLPEEILVHAS
ncbi:MAG: hypothetical protein AUJ55_12765 [Proteobacteria bacterium CG1_02_64_396]|nr:MAG: hypothetical protein AUJ55_12765 [Proteobacteria bacterium CG1_02_64_396]